MTRAFISHSAKDSGFAIGYLKPLLESANITTWCSSAGISCGVDWEKRVRQELTLCDWFIVILSTDAAASEWVRAEVHWATENRKGRIAPLMVRECDPSSIHLKLGTIHFIDFRQAPDSAASNLVQLINGESTKLQAFADAGTLVLATDRSKNTVAGALFSLSIDGQPPQDVLVEIHKECTLGRAIDVDFPIASQTVSRYHARLSLIVEDNEKQLMIVDLESSNGTYVNDTRIHSSQRLHLGDRVAIGSSSLELKGLL